MALKTPGLRTDRPLDAPLLTFDLPTLLTQLKKEDVWKRENRNAITLLQGQGLRVGLVIMHARTTVPSHKAECPMSLQVIEGRLRFNTDAKSVTLTPGQVLTLQAGIRHDMEALEESALLITLATGQAHPAERS